MRLTATLPLLALALAACGGETLLRCTPPPSVLASAAPAPGGPSELSLPAPIAVWVTVVDSATGQDLSAGATGAFVTRSNGTFADSLRHDFMGRLTAYGPAGRYTLVVQHPGYGVWGTDDVRVRQDECGLETQELTARLRREGQP
jgi:hypothetical protein